MGSESGPPQKRLRLSLSGNVRLMECVREFKLPRQYPSMVPKLQNDVSIIEKSKRQALTTGIACIPRATVDSKILTNKEPQPINKIRTIKLRAKDGRDLGEVNVQDLPQNIQGKTITITKNEVKKMPEVIPVTDKAKGITIGVLTPVNILNANDIVNVKSERKSIVDITSQKSIFKSLGVPACPKKISTAVDSQGKPRVLVFQSGKNWHMVKIPSCRPIESTKLGATNNAAAAKQRDTNCGRAVISEIKISKNRENQNISLADNNSVGADSSVLSENKSQIATHNARSLVKKLSQPRTPDSTTDRCKLISPIGAESGETAKPNIEVSRIFASSSAKSAIAVETGRLADDISKSLTKNNTSAQKNPQMGQDVMVALPSLSENNDADVGVISNDEAELPTNSDGSKKTATSSAPATTVVHPQNYNGSAWRRKLLASKNSDAAKYSASRDLGSSSRSTEKNIVAQAERKNELTNNLSILEKALSTVEDEVLREKALKALAECGIGIERLVPVRPASELRPVKDSDAQTSIFGLWESDQFVYVPKDLPVVQRIRITERAPAQKSRNSITNPNSQDLYINGMEMPNCMNTEWIELTNMVEGYVRGNDEANRVAAFFAKPSPVCPRIVEQLQKDYDECKRYDENGLLNIHRAVIADDTSAVIRYLMVLRACEESVDLPTRNGQTSLELAICYDASPKMIKILLDAGAEPTSASTGHDSALTIASRRSIPILMELIPYVKACRLLDNYDSTGFAALHYCAQNGYQEGLTALIRSSANINLCDRRSGRTALFHAVENKHNDLAQMLLENGAETGTPNYGGQTIFNVIDETKHYNLLEVLNRVTK